MNRDEYYLEVLTSFGLKLQEAKIYLACLKLGQATVSQISSESQIQRTFVYDILEDLIEQGLISSVEIRGKKYFSAVSIEKFGFLQEDKLERFKAFLPELKALEQTVGDRPKVRFFEGKEGIKRAFEDTLDQPVGSEILAFSTGEGFFTEDLKFANDYIKERLSRRITVRAIAPNNPETLNFTRKDKKHKRTARLVDSQNFPFANEIDIYGNKVAVISLTGDQMAVIIESESMAKTMRSIFELAWSGAK